MQQFEKEKIPKDLEERKIYFYQYKDCNMNNKCHEKYLQIIDKNIPYKQMNKTVLT